jgi:multidrug efflux pump subunit AcrB
VGFAAITSILTLLPPLQDGLFVSMAVTLVFGLAIATPLVLVVVPVLYSVLFHALDGEAPLKQE